MVSFSPRSWSLYGIAHDVDAPSVTTEIAPETINRAEGLCIDTDVVIEDPYGEENQNITNWLNLETTGPVTVEVVRNKLYKVLFKLTFSNLDDALKFKLAYGDYLVTLHQKVPA